MDLLIVDDEPAARSGLIRLCERSQELRVVGEAGTGAKAIEAVESLRPDLTLLDADLPDMSGFDVLRALQRRHKRRTILLTTSTRDAPGAFAAGALDFLVKPVNEAAFSASILRARARGLPRPPDAGTPRAPGTCGDRVRSRPLLLIGEREHRLYPLDPCQIDYVESAGNYVSYHLAGIEYIARESIKRLETLLASAGFVRIERSLLLNVRAIAYAQPIGHGSFAFTLVSGARLRSGHAYRDTILGALPLRRRALPAIPGSR
ncbi:MAG TPA: LytTR family DNA-binding domain-containing protein [Steroidobacteraceae bacterium]|nr:LytTR family DNA-binding domain-containing protein [Steroidobacteraceae bacterium]